MDNKTIITINADSGGEFANKIAETRAGARIITKGKIDTASFMRMILTDKSLTGGNFLSHIAIFENAITSARFILTDAALNIAPDAEQKAKILRNAIAAHEKLFARAPRISILTAAGRENPKIKSSVDGAALIREFDGDYDIELDQLDTALSPAARAAKSAPPRVADIVLAPDLDTGNAIWKTLTALAGGWTVAGLVVGGPEIIALNSRSDSPESRAKTMEYANRL
ncbi:MAG: hypothetical protein LBR41_00310 [Rickettsiales bacterium]|jgi:phosphotransacetylase|nr:hypothetical protein [Rickettsiales bacterium]